MVTIWSNTNLEAVIGDPESASVGINSEPRPSFIMVEAKSIIAAVSGRSLYIPDHWLDSEHSNCHYDKRLQLNAQLVGNSRIKMLPQATKKL